MAESKPRVVSTVTGVPHELVERNSVACSICGHGILRHYPNFKDGKPLSFYCGQVGCECTRPASEIKWSENAHVVAVGEIPVEPRRTGVIGLWTMRTVTVAWAIFVLAVAVLVPIDGDVESWRLLFVWVVSVPFALWCVWYWWVAA